MLWGCGGHPKSLSFSLSELGVGFSTGETQSNLCFKQIRPAAALEMGGGARRKAGRSVRRLLELFRQQMRGA